MVANAQTASPPAATPSAASSVVLVIAESESIAKRIESYLRNAGHPIRCAWVTDLEDTEEALRRGAPDLLLCADNLQQAPLKDTIDLCRHLAPDLPVVLLSTRFAAEDTVAALAAGAVDHVSYEDLRHLRHLELVLLREFTNHRHLRELRSTRKRLEGFESRHQQLLTDTNDAVAHIQEGILSGVNPSFANLLGYDDVDELNGLPLMDVVAQDHTPKVKEYLKLLLKGKQDGKPLECCLMHRDGRRVSINARLTVSEADGEPLVEMLIRSEASSSAATAVTAPGAPAAHGRIAYFEALAASIAGASQQKAHRAALILAIDNFGGAEDRLGLHDAEQAVDALMEWVRSKLLPGEQVFRFSSSELALLIARPESQEVSKFGETLVAEAPKQIFSTASHEAHLPLTVTAYPYNGSEQASTITSELVREARKLSTKGGKQFANLGPTAKSSQIEREEGRIAALVKKAIEDGRLKLAYQSIASLEGDTRQHFDVLVRVIDEDGKELHASEFIRSAEKHGLMIAIDRWVTARALRVQAKRDSAQEASSLFVKLSEDTLKDAEAFIPWLQEQLKARALKPGEVVFQMQEGIIEKHIRKAKLITKALSDAGAQIAIEHFGTGTNSEQMMEHLPMQFVKFHYNFTKNFNDKDMQKKMTTLMEVAKNKRIKVIVSHVEDANVMARLWQMGVNFIQGYHVQEPEVVLLSAEVGR
ncbi:MAG TPA: EAL domain-containing protein [Solimonas sp.]